MVDHIAQTEFAERIPSPALDRAVVKDCARCIIQCIDRNGGFPRAQVHGSQVVAHFAGSITAMCRVTLTELTVKVFAPALYASVIENRARMQVARGDRDCCFASAEVDGGQIIAHLARVIAAIRRVAQTEPTKRIATPALYAPVVQ